MDQQTRLEHEGHGLVELLWLQHRIACCLEGRRIRSVTAHTIVQTAATGKKAFGLGIVFTIHKPHVFTHHIAMEPGRTESVFGHHPARRKDHEIHIRSTGNTRWRCQHRENGRISVIKADRIHCIERCQIVFVGCVVAMPCNDIQR